jgi:hypothetical protein
MTRRESKKYSKQRDKHRSTPDVTDYDEMKKHKTKGIWQGTEFKNE